MAKKGYGRVDADLTRGWLEAVIRLKPMGGSGPAAAPVAVEKLRSRKTKALGEERPMAELGRTLAR